MQHLFGFLVIILWFHPYEKEGRQEDTDGSFSTLSVFSRNFLRK